MTEFTIIKNNRLYKYLTDRKVSMMLLKVIISAGFLYYIFSNVNLPQLIKTLEKADVKFVVSAFALTSLNLYLQYKKWQTACIYLLHSNEKKKIWVSLLYGIAAGSFTPVRVGEFFGRAVEFRDKSILQITIATLVDKFFLLFVITFAGSIAGIAFLRVHYNLPVSEITTLLAVLALLLSIILLLIFKPEIWKSALINKLKSFKYFDAVREKLIIFKSLDKRFTARMIFISLLFYSVFILQYALLVAAFSGNINFPVFLWAGVLVMFTKSIITPFSFIDFGVREGASIFFLTRMGEIGTVAFNAPVVLFIINIIVPSIIGLILFYKRDNA